MTTRACVIQYTHCTKKKQVKKNQTQSKTFFFFFILASSTEDGGQWGFFEIFFLFFSALLPAAHSVWPCFLSEAGSATCLHCGRQLWSAAGGPAGMAEPATCSGEFVWKRAARARAPLGKRTEPSTADRHTHAHTLTLAHCHPPPPFFTQTLLVFLLLSSPHPLLSSLQGSEITA